jgi:hypothetical protein
VIIKRIAALAAVGLALVAIGAHAQPGGDKPAAAAPSAADIEKAKKAFLEGKKLFDAKKYAEAVDKFKESYRLSKNPLLLYNVGVTLDQKGDKDLALFYYKKFLADAPAEAPQRAEVTARVKELEAQATDAGAGSGSASGSGTGSATATSAGSGSGTGSEAVATTGGGSGSGSETAAGSGSGAGSDTGEPELPHPKHAKGTAYTATDFEHQVVDAAPPGKPLDLNAYAPEDAGWQVTLFYRSAGEATFTSVPMRPRYHELVARIPAKRMTGESVQYYIEVKDKQGAVVTRIGRASSPNLVYLDATAKPRFYPDLDDTDAGTTGSGAVGQIHDDVPPDLHGAENPGGTSEPGGGSMFTPGTRNFERAKWGTTYTAAGLMVVSLTFYLVASSASSSLEGDAARSQTDCTTPPCTVYDTDLKSIESRGRGFNTMTNVAFFLGLAAGGAAGYFWWEEHSHHASEHAAAKRASHDFVATPVVGDGFYGAAAALHF